MLLAKSTPAEVERDAVLWKEMKEGNEFAFREIFETYSNLLFQYGITITKDRELVKDCVQELFIIIWTNRQRIGPARSVKYYMFFSLRRLILKKVKKAKKFFALSTFGQGGLLVVEGQDQAILRKEASMNNQLLVAGALDELPPRQKEIVFLKYYQELGYEEIEKIMNLNNQVVRNTLYKALNSLRKQLGKRQPGAYFFSLLALLVGFF